MEVGPLSSHEFRRELIQQLQSEAQARRVKRVKFQKGATDKDKKYSRFLTDNKFLVRDMQDAEEIEEAMRKLMERCKPEFDLVAQVLSHFLEHGMPVEN